MVSDLVAIISSYVRFVSGHLCPSNKLWHNFGSGFPLLFQGDSLCRAKVGIKPVEDQRTYCFSSSLTLPTLNIYILTGSFSFLVSLAFWLFSGDLSKAYTLPQGCHLPEFHLATWTDLTTSTPSGKLFPSNKLDCCL